MLLNERKNWTGHLNQSESGRDLGTAANQRDVRQYPNRHAAGEGAQAESLLSSVYFLLWHLCFSRVIQLHADIVNEQLAAARTSAAPWS